jgi:hypothetical protein
VALDLSVQRPDARASSRMVAVALGPSGHDGADRHRYAPRLHPIYTPLYSLTQAFFNRVHVLGRMPRTPDKDVASGRLTNDRGHHCFQLVIEWASVVRRKQPTLRTPNNLLLSCSSPHTGLLQHFAKYALITMATPAHIQSNGRRRGPEKSSRSPAGELVAGNNTPAAVDIVEQY